MNIRQVFGAPPGRSAWVASLLLASSMTVGAAMPSPFVVPKVNPEETFTFAGKCFNGEPYRLFLYQKNIAGISQSHYDYNGPAGTGTVQSETPPKVMAARVCRKYAEIINAKYWE